MTPIYEAALAAHDAGLSIIPIESGGAKKPPFKWARYQTERASREQVIRWFAPGTYTGLATICGRVSRNLGILDFDDAATAQLFRDTAEAIGLTVVAEMAAGYAETTPGGGAHLLFFCEAVGRNTVLAARPGPNPQNPKRGRTPLIETRAEGGYGIIAPSNGQVHPSGGAWVCTSGSPATIRTITPQHLAEISALARSFDEMPAEEPSGANPSDDKSAAADEVQPGADFRAQHGTVATFTPLIKKHGWQLVHQRGGVGYYRRPNKAKGISASFGHGGSDLFYVFSTSTEFDSERGYNAFSVFTILEHGGDFGASARALAKAGFGSPQPTLTYKGRPAPGARASEDADDDGGGAPPDNDEPQDDERETSAPGGNNRPEIDAGDQNLERSSDLAWMALRKSNNPPRLFRFGGVPVRLDRPDGDHVPVAQTLDENRLSHELARSANWYKETEKAGMRPAAPPMRTIKDMLAAPSYPFPPLLSIVQAPTFAKDGSLHSTPGYNPATRSFYAPPAGLELPEIADHPTADDVERARDFVLDELIGQFEFISLAERANALTVFFEPYVRNLIDGGTPLRLFEAPTAGVGKGLLAAVLVQPAVGRRINLVTLAGNEEEVRKALTAQLLQAPEVVLFDNISRPIDSGILAATLTAEWWSDRRLGTNDTIHVPVRCLWLATGNNPTMSTEIARRTVRIRLDPKVDRPWQRVGFKHEDLRGWAEENRGRLIWAALTVVRAWLNQGAPKSKKRLGSFEQWAAVMGGILESAGIEGFLENLDEFYEVADTEGALWRQFVGAWFEKFGEQETGVAELFDIAMATEGLDFGKGSERAQRTSFGKQLGRQRDRVIGDYRIQQTRTVQRLKRWRLQRTRRPEPDDDGVHRVHRCTFPNPTPREEASNDQTNPGNEKYGSGETYTNVHDVHIQAPWDDVMPPVEPEEYDHWRD